MLFFSTLISAMWGSVAERLASKCKFSSLLLSTPFCVFMNIKLTKLFCHSWVALVVTMSLKDNKHHSVMISMNQEARWRHAAHEQPVTTGQPPLSPKMILMCFLHFGGILSRDKQVTLSLRQWISAKRLPRQWFHLILFRCTQAFDLRLRRRRNEFRLLSFSAATSCNDSVGKAPLWTSSKSFSSGTSVKTSWDVGLRGNWSIWTNLEKTAEKT